MKTILIPIVTGIADAMTGKFQVEPVEVLHELTFTTRVTGRSFDVVVTRSLSGGYATLTERRTGRTMGPTKFIEADKCTAKVASKFLAKLADDVGGEETLADAIEKGWRTFPWLNPPTT